MGFISIVHEVGKQNAHKIEQKNLKLGIQIE